jgi:hypothetical protein
MMKTKKSGETEIDKLARITNDGFFRVEAGFSRMDNMFKLVFDRFEKVESDIHDIKVTLGPLVSIAAEHERKLANFDARLRRLEYKAGISKIK